MINNSKYQAAQSVSLLVEEHFRNNIISARLKGEEIIAPAPSAKMIERIIDACFWASLRREEGHSPKISLAFVAPNETGQPLHFEKNFPLTSDILTKLSPGVEHSGVHLGVYFQNDELYIWGTTLKIPNYCFVLDVSEPGLLVIKHRRIVGFGKFANVAVLNGDQIKVIDENSGQEPDCPALLKNLLGYTSPSIWEDSIKFLVQLSVSMRAHRHGGTLLFVPGGSDRWKLSIIHPIKYLICPGYSGITDLINEKIQDRTESVWQTSLKNELDRIAGLTAVDGATIINNKYEILAFGAKIARAEGKDRIKDILIIEPIIGGGARIVNPALSGGTRHLSAAQFVFDQHDATALVASQDGNFTIFSWSESQCIVQAHRIDTLLL